MSQASIYIEQSLSIQKTSSINSSAGVNTAIFGGKFEDAFRDAMINSVTQSITTEIGGLSSAGILEEGGVGKALLHAATQCASAELKDGDCKSAAIGAAAAEFASPVANNAGDWGQLISQIAGGIASNASGGDFIAGFDSAGVVDSFNRQLDIEQLRALEKKANELEGKEIEKVGKLSKDEWMKKLTKQLQYMNDKNALGLGNDQIAENILLDLEKDLDIKMDYRKNIEYKNPLIGAKEFKEVRSEYGHNFSTIPYSQSAVDYWKEFANREFPMDPFGFIANTRKEYGIDVLGKDQNAIWSSKIVDFGLIGADRNLHSSSSYNKISQAVSNTFSILKPFIPEDSKIPGSGSPFSIGVMWQGYKGLFQSQTTLNQSKSNQSKSTEKKSKPNINKTNPN